MVVTTAITVRYAMMVERTRRGPKRSPSHPPGTWKSAYAQIKALKITPIVALLKPYSFMMSVAVLARLTRSRYVMRYIKQRRSSTTQRTWLRPDTSSFSIYIPPSTRGRSNPNGSVLIAVFHIYTAPSPTANFFSPSASAQLDSKSALSVPKNTGRRGLYTTVLHWRCGFVGAARFWGGQL